MSYRFGRDILYVKSSYDETIKMSRSDDQVKYEEEQISTTRRLRLEL